MAKHLLHTLKQKDGKGIRHLLTDSIDGNRVVLSEMVNGVETEIARGTKYEMEQKAREHIALGKFSVVRDDGPPVFDSLENTVALAMACGFKTVYDPREKKFPNMLGEVPLASWQGMSGKNGGEYHYGFTGTKILAWPKLPPNHGLSMAPSKEEFASVTLKAMQLQKAVGPDAEFLLGGGNLDFLQQDQL